MDMKDLLDKYNIKDMEQLEKILEKEKETTEKKKKTLKYVCLVLILANRGIDRAFLNKMIYFCDYVYACRYGDYKKTITEDKYFKMSYGPVPYSIEYIRNLCIRDDFLAKHVGKHYKWKHTTVVTYTTKISLDIIRKNILTDKEKEIITLVNKRLGGGLVNLTGLSHNTAPWNSAEYGELLNPELMRDDPIYKELKLKSNNLYELINSDEMIKLGDLIYLNR